MSPRSFRGVQSGRGVTLTPHPLLVPWSSKSRAIPLLPLWAVRPVQSLSACTRVHFTFTVALTSVNTRCIDTCIFTHTGILNKVVSIFTDIWTPLVMLA